MAFSLFESKKSKEEKAKLAEKAKFEAEINAKVAANTERKKVEKMIGEIDKSISDLMAQAADAKRKGYAPVYKQCLSFIKVAKARKAQAEMFLAQISAMQQMKKLADNSKSLLGSMNSIMSSLGKISMDPEVMRGIQKDFMTAQADLDRQSGKIDTFLDGMEMMIPEDMDLDTEQYQDDEIEAEIDSLLATGALHNLGTGSHTASADDTMDYLNRILNS